MGGARESRGLEEIRERLAAPVASGTTLEIDVEGVIETEHSALAATSVTITTPGAAGERVEGRSGSDG